MIKNIANTPNCFYRISVKALILDKEKRFLLTLENKGLWELPGGGLGFGEKPHECLIREIKEETGLEVIHIKEQPSYFLTTLSLNGQQWIGNIIYETKVKNFNFKPSDECVKMKFFTKEEASKEKLFPNIIEFIKMYDPNKH